MHGLGEVFRIFAHVMPYGGRIRIVALEVTVFGNHRLQAFVSDGLSGDLELKDLSRADIAAFGWIDAPEVPVAFTVFGIFTDSHVDQAIVNHGGGNDVVASGGTTEHVQGVLRITIEFPKQLALAVSSPQDQSCTTKPSPLPKITWAWPPKTP